MAARRLKGLHSGKSVRLRFTKGMSGWEIHIFSQAIEPQAEIRQPIQEDLGHSNRNSRQSEA